MRRLLENTVLTSIVNKHRYILWGCMPLFLLILSLGGVYIFAQLSLKEQVEKNIQHLITFMDGIVDNAVNVADQAQSLLDQPCAPVMDRLRQLSLTYPLVHTVNLAENGRFYCTPLPMPHVLLADTDGAPAEPPRVAAGAHHPAGTWQQRIALVASNQIDMPQPMMVLQQNHGRRSVMVVMDTDYIRAMMNMLSEDDQMLLIIGDRFLSPSGQLAPRTTIATSRLQITGQSTHYPYALRMLITPGHLFTHIISTYSYIILLLVAMALVMSVLIRNGLRASGSLKFNMIQGLKRQEFEPYFQPVMDAAGNFCSGGEILSRWQHPTDGFISPDIFIPLAEKSGLVVPLTQQMMRQVAAVLIRTPVSWGQPLHIAFNISASQLVNHQIVEDCRQFQYKVQHKNVILVLELTERQFIDVTAKTLDVMAALKALGVEIAIDDFGTGYSGLAYLGKMDANFLKIDQSFVAMIEPDGSPATLVDVVIDLASRMGMQIIAEGVETDMQRQYLLAKNVAFQQGYLFSKPLPMSQFAGWLSDHQPDADAPATAPMQDAAALPADRPATPPGGGQG